MAKGIYVGVNTPTPVYETTIGDVTINSSNMEDYFDVTTSGTYGFKWNGNDFISNNKGKDGTTAKTILTAKVDMNISFAFGVSSESNYDEFTIIFNEGYIDTADEISGTKSGSYKDTLKTGQTIELIYSKDGSSASGSDAGWIKNIVLSNVEIKTITGYEYKDVARKVKKAYIGCQSFEPRELPSGYTQVEYIETTGTQYINTGFTPNQNSRVILTLQLTQTSNNFFGARSSATSNAFTMSTVKENGVDCWRHGYNTSTINTNVAADTTNKHVVELNKNTMYVDGKLISTQTEATFTCPVAASIGVIRSASNVYSGGAKFYSCKIWDNGTLVRDYVPCTNSSGVIGMYDVVYSKFYGNSGTGVFAVGGASSVARKVKKGYIGIGGVARPFMGGELEYYGTITPLSEGRYSLAATSVGDYALFSGGQRSSSAVSSKVDAYDTSLTNSSAASMTSALYYHSATTVGDYALFGGGNNGSSYVGYVFTYNSSLTRGQAENFWGAMKKYRLAATSVGNYAIFGGGGAGGSYYGTVDAYDASLTHVGNDSIGLSYARSMLAATSVGDYALFGGGNGSGSNARLRVDAYNKSLTRTTATEFSSPKYGLVATTVGNYALFGGGPMSDLSVEVYDTSLTRLTALNLSEERYSLAAVTVGKYALFGGGTNLSTYEGIATVDVYDASLTKTVTTNLREARSELAATAVGDYALFGGGDGYDGATVTVDAYVAT